MALGSSDSAVTHADAIISGSGLVRAPHRTTKKGLYDLSIALLEYSPNRLSSRSIHVLSVVTVLALICYIEIFSVARRFVYRLFMPLLPLLSRKSEPGEALQSRLAESSQFIFGCHENVISLATMALTILR